MYALRAILLISTLTLAPLTALAGEVVVGGKRLDGRAVGVGKEGVKFETDFGKGAIEIPWDRVERIETDVAFVLLYGDDGTARGRILGVEAGEVLVGEDRASAARVPAAQIFQGIEATAYDGASTWRRLKTDYRFWRAKLGVRAGLTQGTTDSSSAAIGFEVERRKAPTRLLVTFDYLTSDQRDDGVQERLDNELRGSLRGEYDLSKKLFAFTSFSGDYDQIERLNFRGVSKLGLGYRFWELERGSLLVDFGGSYLYEDYFRNPPPDPRDSKRDYFALSFGADGKLKLPYGALLTARAEYLPSVTDWTGNYLLRGSLKLGIPLLEWLSFDFALYDEFNSEPADGANENKLTLSAGLGLTF